MLKTPELTMPRTRKVTNVYNGNRGVWMNYEEAKAYFLEPMMSTDGEEYKKAESVYIQLLHGLDARSDEVWEVKIMLNKIMMTGSSATNLAIDDNAKTVSFLYFKGGQITLRNSQ